MAAMLEVPEPPEREYYASIPIRYDGGDAAAHVLELGALAESLAGIARILGVVGHFALTEKYVRQQQALDVRVLIKETRANCFTVQAVLDAANQYQLFSGAGAGLLVLAVQYVFARISGQREEMKHLADALNKAIEGLSSGPLAMNERLMQTLDKMAEGLRGAARQAVAPVGRSCTSMTIGQAKEIDQATAEAIRRDDVDELTEEREWEIVITELDMENATSKVRLVADEPGKRIRANITDPAIKLHPNAYVLSLAGAPPSLKVRGKAALREGQVVQLFISDTVPLA